MSHTPTPTPTKSPSPTPACTPVAITPALPVALASPGNTLQLNAQGQFAASNPKTPKFHDVTNDLSTLWFTLSGNVTYAGNGVLVGAHAGCDCVTAHAGGVDSQTISVAVATPLAACTPCPQNPPTP
jgi:hypothetical protein